MSEETKPCPFCGGKVSLKEGKAPYLQGYYYIECDNLGCGCHPNTFFLRSADEVIADWNTRSGEINRD